MMRYRKYQFITLSLAAFPVISVAIGLARLIALFEKFVIAEPPTVKGEDDNVVVEPVRIAFDITEPTENVPKYTLIV